MRKTQFVSVLVAAFLAGLAGAWVVGMKAGQSADHASDSTYDRVMRTQTIRCSYILWPPAFIKDPNTGKFSGMFYDYTEALGKALHLKIEWVEEMGWSDFPAALQTGRVDAMCSGSFSNSARARVIDFARPIFYMPMYAYARAGDTRFDNKLEAINDPSVTIITVEGATGPLVAAQDFPKAKSLLLPEMTNIADSFVSLTTGKGDICLTPSSTARDYDNRNPGKIHRIAAGAPLRYFGVGIAVAAQQERFRRMLDFATGEMLSSGEIEKIVEKYDNSPGDILRIALPYQNSEAAHN